MLPSGIPSLWTAHQRHECRLVVHARESIPTMNSSLTHSHAVPQPSLTPMQLNAEVEKLLGTKAQLEDAEARARAAAGIPRNQSGRNDYSRDFFARTAYLAVSGQLNAEAYACALSDVYTFGEHQSGCPAQL